jgi:hypothetical protein
MPHLNGRVRCALDLRSDAGILGFAGKFMSQLSSIKEVVASGELPAEASEILPLLTNADKTYLLQEGECWDFKESWPFSYSDDYFFGLARLICAFQNTEGGLVIFGVDDKSRKGGRTKTIPNLDRFELAFKQLTGVSPKLSIARYVDDECGDVDVLLVRTKGAYDLPIRFLKNGGKYKKGTVWVRKSSEVVDADSSDIPLLYLSQDRAEALTRQPAGQLFPSQSTLRDFVGRLDTLDKLFSWLALEDEPRAFLYGKGGSGKSTIAYELFKQLKLNGGSYRLGKSDLIDQIMFITAKSTYLNVEQQQIQEFQGNDFKTEDELYRAVLILGGAASDSVETDSTESLKQQVREFLEQTACFMIIDDIDTLTTAGEEGGLDFLFGAVVRSKRMSKVLYTLRNRPTHSLKSSIEVPGLEGSELEEFVVACVNQFKVPAPKADFVTGRLKKVSEGRPLVIESIIALRRHAGSYDRAVEMFERGSGDDVRQYVFKREWEAIDPASRGKEILACLALHGKPMSFDDISAVARLEPSRVRDAIAAVQEMFLQTEDDEADTLFSLGALTKGFVEQEAPHLDHFETIKARVENFRRSAYPESPILARISREVRRAEYECANGDREPLKEILWKLHGDRYPPETMENPRFLALRAYAETFQEPLRFETIRDDFRAALAMGYAVPIEFIRRWFLIEATSDTAYRSTKEIIELMGSMKRYSLSERTEIRFEYAIFLYNSARAMAVTDPFRSLDRIEGSLSEHLAAYYAFNRSRVPFTQRSATFTRNTAFYFAQRATFLEADDRFFDAVLKAVRTAELWLDPLVEPIQLFLQLEFRNQSLKLDRLNKLISKTDLLAKEATKSTSFLLAGNKDLLLEQISAFRKAAKETIEKLRKVRR